MYNFQKISVKDEENWEFFHPFFDRHHPEQLERVVRQTSKLFRSNPALREQIYQAPPKSSDPDQYNLLKKQKVATDGDCQEEPDSICWNGLARMDTSKSLLAAPGEH